jgi:SAM-dependent methyltransferase
MISEAKFLAKQPFRARGVAELEQHVGAVRAEIEARLRPAAPVRILELGCGYGSVLLELAAAYGESVALTGQNREPRDGDAAMLERNAAHRGIVLRPDRPRPRIVHGDVAGGLPFASGSFDLVVSQVAWLYFGNKIGVIREVMRVLAPGGVARIDADELRPGLPVELARLVEIWESGRLVPLAEYLARFGGSLAAAPDGHYLRFGPAEGFGSDLDLVAELDLNALHRHWDGIKCVYRVRERPPGRGSG